MKWNYKFLPLEEFSEENMESDNDSYQGHYEVDIEKINKFGDEGFELFQIIMINGIQHGWFKKKIENE
jgi:hypothetical protein